MRPGVELPGQGSQVCKLFFVKLVSRSSRQGADTHWDGEKPPFLLIAFLEAVHSAAAILMSAIPEIAWSDTTRFMIAFHSPPCR